jgi:hypothetical protein
LATGDGSGVTMAVILYGRGGDENQSKSKNFFMSERMEFLIDTMTYVLLVLIDDVAKRKANVAAVWVLQLLDLISSKQHSNNSSS